MTTLTNEQIIDLGHRWAWRYKFSSAPNHSSTYTFNDHHLVEFVRAIERAQAEAALRWQAHASDCATHNEPAYPNGPCDCGLAGMPLQNDRWYWIEYEGLGKTYTAPAMYKANVDCFYSYEFSGIPTRQVTVLREAAAPSAPAPNSVAKRKQIQLEGDGFEPYAATVFRKGDRYCILGALGDVRFAGAPADVMADAVRIKIKGALFSFSSKQEWVNKGKSRYANCGVQRGMYVTVDANGHVMHMGKCFAAATEANAYPVTVFELATNWELPSTAEKGATT